MGGVRLWRRFFALPLTSEFDALYGSNANPLLRTLSQRSVLRRPERGRKQNTAPKDGVLFSGVPGGIRTLDLPVRSRALYPLSYGHA